MICDLRQFDIMIGRFDRLLSEVRETLGLAASVKDIDEADWQTIKHHADDLIGVGSAALKRFGERRCSPLTDVQIKLRALFDGFASSPIVWQEFASKELWLDAECAHAIAVAEEHRTDDPLVAFDVYARALGLLILANQLGGG